MLARLRNRIAAALAVAEPFDVSALNPGCAACWHGVVAGSQGNRPCEVCSFGDWDNLRLVDEWGAELVLLDAERSAS